MGVLSACRSTWLASLPSFQAGTVRGHPRANDRRDGVADDLGGIDRVVAHYPFGLAGVFEQEVDGADAGLDGGGTMPDQPVVVGGLAAVEGPQVVPGGELGSAVGRRFHLTVTW